MDWPLTGALAGVGILTSVVGFGTFALLRSGPESVRKVPGYAQLMPATQRPAAYAPVIERPAYAPVVERPAFAVPDDPSDEPQVASPAEGAAPPRPPSEKRATPRARVLNEPAATPVERKNPAGQKPHAEVGGNAPPSSEPRKMASAHIATSGSASEPDVTTEQWRVTTTSKASYFNLGGHVDKAGAVDSLASGHLREALRKNKNFDKLPNHIKVHINTQNIDLVMLAPYGALLGLDYRKMELEQGVRFERVARSR
jgi:hypothetical protein